MSEERIKKDVFEQLIYDDRIDASKVDVSVEGRRVILKGIVPTYTVRQIAEMDAFTVLGVATVENDLEIKHPDLFAVATDEEIKTNIKHVLSWNPDIDATDIDVFVLAGHVTLEGSVDAFWKKIRAGELASTMVGITAITNKLAVVPSESVADKLIAERIQSALDRNALVDSEHIDIKVENGNVTLSGEVPTNAAYNVALDLASHAAGVVGIHNAMTVA